MHGSVDNIPRALTGFIGATMLGVLSRVGFRNDDSLPAFERAKDQPHAVFVCFCAFHLCITLVSLASVALSFALAKPDRVEFAIKQHNKQQSDKSSDALSAQRWRETISLDAKRDVYATAPVYPSERTSLLQSIDDIDTQCAPEDSGGTLHGPVWDTWMEWELRLLLRRGVGAFLSSLVAQLMFTMVVTAGGVALLSLLSIHKLFQPVVVVITALAVQFAAFHCTRVYRALRDVVWKPVDLASVAAHVLKVRWSFAFLKRSLAKGDETVDE